MGHRIEGESRLAGQTASVGSADEMFKAVKQAMEGSYGIPKTVPAPNELLMEVDGKANYQLRLTRQRFSVAGVVNRMPRSQFLGMVQAALAYAQQRHTLTQQGDWRPVAWRLDRGYRITKQRQPTGLDPNRAWAPGRDDQGLPTSNPQVHRIVSSEAEDLVLTVVCAELSQSPPIDPLYEERRRRDGAMYAYAESGGLLRHLPSRMMDERNACKEVIRYHYDVSDTTNEAVLSDDMKARVVSLGAMLDASEIARALGVSALAVEHVLTQPAPKTRRKRGAADA